MDDVTGTPQNSLDSAYIVGFEKLHELTETVLRDRGGINYTQFRLLLKSAEKEGDACLLSEIAEMIHLQPNVVSQAANALESLGLIVRETSKKDARAKSIVVTVKGRLEIEHLNAELRDGLYLSFNPSNDPQYKATLEETIYAAARIETSLSREFIDQHLASASMLTYNIVLQRIKDALHEAVDVSFNECRMLQRLSEVGQPMRAVDLSLQLLLPATTITRSATRLEKRGWLVRLISEINRQAVFMDMTDEGRRQAQVVLETIDTVSYDMLWSHFDDHQRAALRGVGEAFLSNMRAQDNARRYALLDDLTPLSR